MVYFVLGVLWELAAGDAEAKARQYAELNGSKMTDYTSPFVLYSIPKIKFVERIPVPPVPVRVEVERDVPMIYEALYGNGRRKFKVRARATAEAYLKETETRWLLCVDPCCIHILCICIPVPSVIRSYYYKWGVRLVE
jgi:hypothetical protein